MASDEEVHAMLRARLARFLGLLPESYDRDSVVPGGINRAHRFLKGYADDFAVDLSALNYPKFFDGFEAQLRFPEFSWLVRALSPNAARLWREHPARPHISVGHLIGVARAGAWHDPPPTPYIAPLNNWPRWLKFVSKACSIFFKGIASALALLLIFIVAQHLFWSVLALTDGRWLAAIGHMTFAALTAFIFQWPIYLATQQAFRRRFGMHWNFRHSALRPIAWKPTP